MPMRAFEEILARIEDAFPRLSPQLRQAARHVIDHPDDVALYSMRQLAAQANVHPSTMVRLARELGFEGHAQFQEPFQARLRSRPKVSYTGSARSLQARGGNGNAAQLIAEMVNSDRQSLSAVLDELGADALVQAADALCRARKIFFVGVRSLYPVAFYMHYATRMFSHNVDLVDGIGGTFADQLRGVGKGDVVLAVSFAPYSRNTVRAVDYAVKQGAKIIAITDSALSPIARHPGGISLVVRNDSPSFFYSVVPAMAVAEILVMLMAADGGEGALKALEDSADQLNGFDAYWIDRAARKGER